MFKYYVYKVLHHLGLVSDRKYNQKEQKCGFKTTKEYKAIAKSKLFDAKWYLKQNPDVKASGMDPVLHYLKYGWKEKRSCTPYFDGKQYLEMYPDVARAGVNPLLHWELHGKFEGRFIIMRPRLSYVARVLEGMTNFVGKVSIIVEKLTPLLNQKKKVEKSKEYSLLAHSPYFDIKWYLTQYPDIEKAKVDPVEHYLRYGWREGRNPSKKFNGNEYLDLYRDVKKANINPLVHYLKNGQKEGRLTIPVYERRNKWTYSFIKKKIFHYRKKILLLSHEFSYTGAPLSLLKAAQCYREMGYDIVTISLKDGPLKPEFKKISKVYISNTLSFVLKKAFSCDWCIINTIVPFIFYDVIHKYVPTIWWIREPRNILANRETMTQTLKNASSIYVMSDYSRNEFLDLNPNIKVIKHGLDDCYTGKRININRLSFAVIGSIEERKGQDLFLKAIKKLPKKIAQKAKFYIVGNCLSQQYMEELRQLKVQNVEFVNPITDFNEMLHFYEQISCVVVPSRDEPTSRITLEAMMMGRPAIVSNRVGASYLIEEGQNGFVFPTEDSSYLSKLLKHIITHPKKLKEMESCARKAYLANNSIEVYKKNLQKILMETPPIVPSAAKINLRKIQRKTLVPDAKLKGVSIIIPVYNALEDLKKLIESIEKAKLGSDTEIILIDDASQEDVKLYLKSLEKQELFKIYYNQQNLGFIKTCNKGMDLARYDIVVLLNSDTRIPVNFKEKILRCFAKDRNIACASPISTNSGWFSIKEDSNYNLECLNKVADQFGGKYPMITPEGFCFAMRKRVIDKIGKLDEIFGKGYSEEDDWVMRALLHGYRTILIDNLVVAHKRHSSFSSVRRQQILKQNRLIFEQRWGKQQEQLRQQMGVAIIAKKINCLLDASTGIPVEKLRMLHKKNPSTAIIYAMYSKDGLIASDKVKYLVELKKYTNCLIVVADNKIHLSELEKIKSIVDMYQFMPHGEYDFGSYKRGFDLLRQNALLDKLNTVVFCNDSVVYLGKSLRSLFSKLHRFNFYGITQHEYGYDIKESGYSWIRVPHIQSYFFSVKRPIFINNKFQQFLYGVKKEENKKDIIVNYEIGLSRLLKNMGYELASYYPKSSEDVDLCERYLHPKGKVDLFIKRKYLDKSKKA